MVAMLTPIPTAPASRTLADMDVLMTEHPAGRCKPDCRRREDVDPRSPTIIPAGDGIHYTDITEVWRTATDAVDRKLTSMEMVATFIRSMGWDVFNWLIAGGYPEWLADYQREHGTLTGTRMWSRFFVPRIDTMPDVVRRYFGIAPVSGSMHVWAGHWNSDRLAAHIVLYHPATNTYGWTPLCGYGSKWSQNFAWSKGVCRPRRCATCARVATYRGIRVRDPAEPVS